ncbi:MAG: hypothetical protein QOE96_2338 [Blastocatellia bacterium]|jgi:hypothetical protein|nr:hypothetical protein [Blastocatellia bacterium]
MDAREELTKITLGKIVSGLLLLIGFLVVVVWRETLFGKWTQIAEGLSKPALMALLGLALIAALLEALGVAYLLYLLYRERPEFAKSPVGPNAITPPTGGYVGMFGVLWDEHDNACCPICKVLMSHLEYTIGGFKCPSCHRGFILKDDVGTSVNTLNAKRQVTERRYELAQKTLHLSKKH